MNTNINSTAEGKSDAIIIQLLAEMREQRSAYREEQLLAARSLDMASTRPASKSSVPRRPAR